MAHTNKYNRIIVTYKQNSVENKVFVGLFQGFFSEFLVFFGVWSHPYSLVDHFCTKISVS